MTPLIALPAGPFPDAEPSENGARPATALPALPVLSALLHGATRLAPANDWRSGVLAALAMPGAASAHAAAVAACAIPALPPGAGVCLALPVHAVAGMSRMFLGTADSFVLQPAERDALRAAFNTEFGAGDVRLHGVGSGWLLQGAFAGAADDGDPELLVGTALAREPARSATGRVLRRLGAEVEMWLAGLPLNRERERRGAPPINCFWFWSGTQSRALQAPQQLPGGIFSNMEPDAWLAGLARLCGMPVVHALDWHQVRDRPGALVILQPPLLGQSMSQFESWEAAWLEPASHDLASGHLAALRLQVGGSAWQLPAPRLTRWLRRSRPWWHAVSA